MSSRTAEVSKIKTPVNMMGSLFSFLPNIGLVFTNSSTGIPSDFYLAGTHCNCSDFCDNGGNGSCGRSAPLSYSITSTFCSASQAVNISQDQRDIIRQEYIRHGLSSVPDRTDLLPTTDSLYFLASALNQTAYSLSWGSPGALADSVYLQYNNLLNTTPSTATTFTITSGWRNPERNEAVGGVQNSDHQFGNALDLVPLDWQDHPELFCTLLSAAQNVGGTFVQAENALSQRVNNCADSTVRHIHVSQR